MVALVSVVVVATVSLLITRVATVALTLTGMSREASRFQARSALSGVGFTTSEAEGVVNHPVRRRIVMMLMLIGSAGLATAVAGLMLSFINADPGQVSRRALILVPALLGLLVLARSEAVDRWLTRVIARGLDRWTDLEARDYSALLHLGGDYGVVELGVTRDSPLADRPLAELELRERGAILLGVVAPDGTYAGAPGWDTRLRAGDTAIFYGRREAVCALGRQDPVVPDTGAATSMVPSG
jgi:hypothetical protein